MIIIIVFVIVVVVVVVVVVIAIVIVSGIVIVIVHCQSVDTYILYVWGLNKFLIVTLPICSLCTYKRDGNEILWPSPLGLQSHPK